jgi:hypothetical protein
LVSPKRHRQYLSLSKVKKNGYRITFDSNNENEFHVHKPNGETRVFSESPRGLYFMDAKAEPGTVLLHTVPVEDNKNNFTTRDYSQATLARKIQTMIGRPSTRGFIRYVNDNLLKNCPITARDIRIAEQTFGPDVGSLKGKTVRRSTGHVRPNMMDIPLSIMENYRAIVLGGDIMLFVNNKIPFFLTVSRNIKFCTAEMPPNPSAKTMLTAFATSRPNI